MGGLSNAMTMTPRQVQIQAKLKRGEKLSPQESDEWFEYIYLRKAEIDARPERVAYRESLKKRFAKNQMDRLPGDL